MHRLIPLCIAAFTATAAAGQPPWPVEMTDPAALAAQDPRAADLMLPLPCNGEMAFQRVVTPVQTDNPLSDRRVRLGDPDPATGYSDYLRTTYLRGPFRDPATDDAQYWIGRYEVTQDQAAALRGDCPDAPTIRGRIPQTGLSQLDAMLLARDYSRWLLANAPDAIEGGRGAFLRLPTNAEWEFAARGGTAVEPDIFNARVFPAAQQMIDVAWLQAPGSAQGTARPVGLIGGNPLGLHDIYGNAEELTLDLFHLNALGRTHGQVGGVVTRGGSFFSTPEQVYSARRTEWPAYTASGEEMRQPSFGVRLVIARHVAVSDGEVSRIAQAWQDGLIPDQSGSDGETPLDRLEQALERETDQVHRTELEGIRQLVLARSAEIEQVRQSALEAIILSGAVMIEGLRADDRARANALNVIARLETALPLAPDASSGQRVANNISRTREALRVRQARIDAALSSYARAIVSTVQDYSAAQIQRAADALDAELRAAGQSSLTPAALDFRSDLATYRTQPNLPRDAMLSLALD